MFYKSHFYNVREIMIVGRKNSTGFTLMELVVVIVIIGILSLVGIRSISKRAENQKFLATISEMNILGNALVGNEDLITSGTRIDFGYVGDNGAFPTGAQIIGGALAPYLDPGFQGTTQFFYDAWNQQYIWNINNLTIRSTGGSQTITKDLGDPPDFLNNTISGNISDREAFAPTTAELANITITLDLQSGGQLTATKLSGGGYIFQNNVHIGNHTITAVYSTANDTVRRSASVIPNGDLTIDIVFFAF